jgi:hypothetical protein
MIKTAQEIVAITKEAEKNKMAERHDRTMDYINGAIAREIEKTARKGEVDVKFRVTDALDRDLIKSVLTSAGYDVAIKGYEVKISWLMLYVKA